MNLDQLFPILFEDARKVSPPYGIVCDGNAYASIADNASLNGGSQDFTIELWYKSSGAPGDWEVLARKDAEYSLQIYGVGASEFVSLFMWEDTGGTEREFGHSGTDVHDGEWHHIAGVWDRSANEARIFIDGVLVANNRGNNTFDDDINVGTILAIGSISNGGQGAVGTIDDIRITMAEVYTATFPVPTGPLTALAATKGLWDCQENEGTTLGDSSPEGNDCAFGAGANAPAWGDGKFA